MNYRCKILLIGYVFINRTISCSFTVRFRKKFNTLYNIHFCYLKFMLTIIKLREVYFLYLSFINEKTLIKRVRIRTCICVCKFTNLISINYILLPCALQTYYLYPSSLVHLFLIGIWNLKSITRDICG